MNRKTWKQKQKTKRVARHLVVSFALREGFCYHLKKLVFSEASRSRRGKVEVY